jgi:anti-anti-sigma regulatory factor
VVQRGGNGGFGGEREVSGSVWCGQAGSGLRLLGVDGELDQRVAARLERLVEEQLASAPRLLVLDLSGLISLQPEGVQALVRVAFRAGEQNIGLCVVIPDDGRIEAALRDAGSLELFELHGSIDSALASCAD